MKYYLGKQWAAEMTIMGSQLNKMAPQPLHVLLVVITATCHGNSFSTAGTPPTIFGS